MTEQPFPATDTTVVHKDDYAKSVGPVWQVTGQNPETKDVNLAHALKHKLNSGLKPEFRHVPVSFVDTAASISNSKGGA